MIDGNMIKDHFHCFLLQRKLAANVMTKIFRKKKNFLNARESAFLNEKDSSSLSLSSSSFTVWQFRIYFFLSLPKHCPILFEGLNKPILWSIL